MLNDIFFDDELTAVLIEGPSLYAASRNLGFDVDYKALRDLFRAETSLVTLNYYVAVVDSDDYTPVKPLTDWLSYNGYNLVKKSAREFTDADGKRHVRGSVNVEMAIDMLLLAQSKNVQHIVVFTADGSLRYPIEMAQRMHGVRVTVVATTKAMPMCSDEIRRQASQFLELDDFGRTHFRRQINERAYAA